MLPTHPPYDIALIFLFVDLLIRASQSLISCTAPAAAARANLNVVRFFAFATQEGEALQTAPGSYDEALLVGLDTAIALAGEAGLKVILALANNWDYTGNASDTKCAPFCLIIGQGHQA